MRPPAQRRASRRLDQIPLIWSEHGIARHNGLAEKHFLDLKRGKLVELEVIVDCKANPEKRIIEALAVIFKDERAKEGIDMK